MNKLFFLILFFLMNLSINAQNTISLDQAYQYINGNEGIPDNVSYIKDINNKLNPFIGIWKGSYDNKVLEIKFEKKVNDGNSDLFWDRLYGRLLVKNSINGSVLLNSMNNNLTDTGVMIGSTFQRNTYMLNFVYKSECNDFGMVYIEKLNNNSITLYFNRNSDLIYDMSSQCPNYRDYNTLLPLRKITLTKQ
ncbi:DUF6705 family protein [Faecalibacter rhinopitheci]|nr:DUF6705 family protein [Faecalibacter rhinopitheci]